MLELTGRSHALSILCIVCRSVRVSGAAPSEWAVKNQRVEYMQSPAMGIDVPSPRFAWILDSSSSSGTYAWRCLPPRLFSASSSCSFLMLVPDPSQRGVYQDSYQIVVTEADTGVTAWDSGRVHSPENRHVPYGSTTASHAKPSGRSMVTASNLVRVGRPCPCW